ncbi:hypothetical protein [Vibrio makurazakiensis]
MTTNQMERIEKVIVVTVKSVATTTGQQIKMKARNSSNILKEVWS